MASKIILDSERLLEETLISLTEACRCVPGGCSRPALERWIRKGSRGTVLESILVCGRRKTSKEAVDRFIRGQLQVAPERPAPKRGSMSKRELEEKARRFGLPEPQGTVYSD